LNSGPEGRVRQDARARSRREGSGTLTFTYLPGRGTTLSAGNKELGAFAGKGFADAVFSIWLGPKPPSEDLKKGLLG
jgi:hypothetical protein